MNTTESVTIIDGATDISARNQGGSLTFSIVISREEWIHPRTVNKTLAAFPFAGTLHQAEMEAGRILSCFKVKAGARVTVWFELEDLDN